MEVETVDDGDGVVGGQHATEGLDLLGKNLAVNNEFHIVCVVDCQKGKEKELCDKNICKYRILFAIINLIYCFFFNKMFYFLVRVVARGWQVGEGVEK